MSADGDGGIAIKRVYEAAETSDGYRVLVDRLWPRGVSHERAALDLWLKEVAPSPDLRVWFAHRDDRFREFTERYRAELDGNSAVPELLGVVRGHPVTTLLYGAKSATVNHAVVLADYLRSLV